MHQDDVLLRLRSVQSGQQSLSPHENEDLLEEAITEIELLRALVGQQTVAEIAAELHRFHQKRRSRSAFVLDFGREKIGSVVSRLFSAQGGQSRPHLT